MTNAIDWFCKNPNVFILRDLQFIVNSQYLYTTIKPPLLRVKIIFINPQIQQQQQNPQNIF